MIESVYIDDLQIHRTESYALSRLRGLGSPVPRRDVVGRARYHGATDSTAYYEGRVIELEGRARGATVAALHGALDALQGAFALGSDHVFKFRREGEAADLQATVRAASSLDYELAGTRRSLRWTVQLLSHDPRLYAGLEQTASYRPSSAQAGGVTFPLSFPLTFSGAGDDTVEALNGGNFPTPPVLAILGPAVNPIIDNGTTGDAIYTVGVNLTQDDRIVIDVARRRVTLGFNPDAIHGLTVSGNEITDVTRAARVEGDGRASDGSFGIWEPTTNRHKNSGAETDLSSTSAHGAGSFLERTSEWSKFGSYSFKVTPGTSPLAGMRTDSSLRFTTAAGTTHTVSAWFKGQVGKRVRIRFVYFDSGGVQLGTINDSPLLTLDGTTVGQRLAFAAASPANAATFYAALVAELANDPVFYVEGIQVEDQPLATPLVHTDGTTATRAAARVRGPASVLDETQAWCAIRARIPWGTTNEPFSGAGFPRFFYWDKTGDSANHKIDCYYNEGSNLIAVESRSGGVVTSRSAAFSPTAGVDDHVTVIVAWTATSLKLSVNGGAFSSVALAAAPDGLTSSFDIASSLGGAHLDGDVLWFACGTGVLADADAAAIAALPDDTYKASTFPVPASMVWGADDAYYRTARTEVGEAERPDLIDARQTTWLELQPDGNELGLRGSGFQPLRTELAVSWRDAQV